MNNKILKEALIIILLFLVVMFSIGILFYDSIPTNSEQIVSVQYVTDENVNSTLEEIKSNTGIDVKDEESSSLLKSYTISAEDLSIYASENSYESGKKDPFAEYAEPIDEVVTKTTQRGTTNNSQISNPIVSEEIKDTNTVAESKVSEKKESKENKVVENKIEDKKENSSSQGTFFENKNSK